MPRPVRWHQTLPLEIEGPPGPTTRPGPLTPHQLVKSRLRIAHEALVEVVSDADLLPAEARSHVAAAVGHLLEARALTAGEANT
jgi:hypothetical protein